MEREREMRWEERGRERIVDASYPFIPLQTSSDVEPASSANFGSCTPFIFSLLAALVAVKSSPERLFGISLAGKGKSEFDKSQA
jgi:hypothetical protein